MAGEREAAVQPGSPRRGDRCAGERHRARPFQGAQDTQLVEDPNRLGTHVLGARLVPGERCPVHHHHGVARGCQQQRGGAAGGPAADHQHVGPGEVRRGAGTRSHRGSSRSGEKSAKEYSEHQRAAAGKGDGDVEVAGDEAAGSLGDPGKSLGQRFRLHRLPATAGRVEAPGRRPGLEVARQRDHDHRAPGADQLLGGPLAAGDAAVVSRPVGAGGSAIAARRRQRQAQGQSQNHAAHAAMAAPPAAARFTPSLSSHASPPRWSVGLPHRCSRHSLGSSQCGTAKSSLCRGTERGVEQHPTETYQRRDRKQCREARWRAFRWPPPAWRRRRRPRSPGAVTAAAGSRRDDPAAEHQAGCRRAPRAQTRWPRCPPPRRRGPTSGARHRAGGATGPRIAAPAATPAVGEDLPVVPTVALGIEPRRTRRSAGDETAGHEEGGENPAAFPPGAPEHDGPHRPRRPGRPIR